MTLNNSIRWNSSKWTFYCKENLSGNKNKQATEKDKNKQVTEKDKNNQVTEKNKNLNRTQFLKNRTIEIQNNKSNDLKKKLESLPKKPIEQKKESFEDFKKKVQLKFQEAFFIEHSFLNPDPNRANDIMPSVEQGDDDPLPLYVNPQTNEAKEANRLSLLLIEKQTKRNERKASETDEDLASINKVQTIIPVEDSQFFEDYTTLNVDNTIKQNQTNDSKSSTNTSDASNQKIETESNDSITNNELLEPNLIKKNSNTNDLSDQTTKSKSSEVAIEKAVAANIIKYDLKKERIINDKNQLFATSIVAENLIKLEPFKSLKICISSPSPQFLMYLDYKYKSVSKNFILQTIYQFFRKHNFALLYKNVRELFEQICLIHSVEPEEIEPKLNFVLLKNNLLCIKTFEVSPQNNQIIPGIQLDFNYVPISDFGVYKLDQLNNLTPNFYAYINNVCNSDQSKILLLQSFLTCLIHGYNQTQTFLYLFGPGASGKSVFAQICIALVSQDKTISTSLAQMNRDNFEAMNYKDKRLILINESEQYRGPLYRLKQVTGGDMLSGREKNVQGSFDFTYNGLVLVISNHPFQSTEPTNALKRRVREIESPNSIPEKQQIPLLYWCFIEKKWKGCLASELGHIFNWALSLDLEWAGRYIKNYVSETTEDGLINPLEEFIKVCFIYKINNNLKIGFTKESELSYEEIQKAINEKYVYPVYRHYCALNDEKPIGRRLFAQAFVETSRQVFDATDITKERIGGHTLIRNLDYSYMIELDIEFYRKGRYNPDTNKCYAVESRLETRKDSAYYSPPPIITYKDYFDN